MYPLYKVKPNNRRETMSMDELWHHIHRLKVTPVCTGKHDFIRKDLLDALNGCNFHIMSIESRHLKRWIFIPLNTYHLYHSCIKRNNLYYLYYSQYQPRHRTIIGWNKPMMTNECDIMTYDLYYKINGRIVKQCHSMDYLRYCFNLLETEELYVHLKLIILPDLADYTIKLMFKKL